MAIASLKRAVVWTIILLVTFLVCGFIAGSALVSLGTVDHIGFGYLLAFVVMGPIIAIGLAAGRSR